MHQAMREMILNASHEICNSLVKFKNLSKNIQLINLKICSSYLYRKLNTTTNTLGNKWTILEHGFLDLDKG